MKKLCCNPKILFDSSRSRIIIVEHFTRGLKIRGLYFLFAVCSVFIAANNHLAVGSNCNVVFICYKEAVVSSNNS